VHEHHVEKRKLLTQAKFAMEAFRSSDQFRKSDAPEFDDWKAIEEILADAADDEPGEEEEDDSVDLSVYMEIC
jgi:hypothetical protein